MVLARQWIGQESTDPNVQKILTNSVPAPTAEGIVVNSSMHAAQTEIVIPGIWRRQGISLLRSRTGRTTAAEMRRSQIPWRRISLC